MGVSEVMAAVGVFKPPVETGVGGDRVSRVSEAAFEDSFLVEELGNRNTDFQVWELWVLRG